MGGLQNPPEHRLNLGLGWWKIAGFALGCEAIAAMRAVTEGLILGKTAAAERDNFSTGESEGIALEVCNLKVPFNANGTVS
jgi:hypothetical protein